MAKKIQLLLSGIPLVDLAWGGLYRGGTYFLIGPRKSGRTLLALQFAKESAEQKDICLFFTSMRPKDLMIHAASIDFDLQKYMDQNLIIVVRVTPPVDLEEVDDADEYLAEYIKDLVPVVKQYMPAKIVFDELSSFISFKNIKLLKSTFLKAVESIEDAGITSLFSLGEPANPASHSIVDLLLLNSTGVINLQKKSDVVDKYHSGIMTITPNVGHTEGKFSSNYFIEPDKGIIVDFKLPKKVEQASEYNEGNSKDMYKSLSEITDSEEAITISNVYSLEDFELLVNNQIAYYKITGKIFQLVSLRLDERALPRNIITLNQLRNAVRLSTDKKDKICTIENNILVLISTESKNAVPELVTKIKSNLPNNNHNIAQRLTRLISVYSISVSDEFQNSKEMIARILNNKSVRIDKSPLS